MQRTRRLGAPLLGLLYIPANVIRELADCGADGTQVILNLAANRDQRMGAGNNGAERQFHVVDRAELLFLVHDGTPTLSSGTGIRPTQPHRRAAPVNARSREQVDMKCLRVLGTPVHSGRAAPSKMAKISDEECLALSANRSSPSGSP